MTNMTNQLFAQVTKEMLKKIGADDNQIRELDLTQEHLMGKIAHIGSANKKKELGDHIRGMANNFKHKES